MRLWAHIYEGVCMCPSVHGSGTLWDRLRKVTRQHGLSRPDTPFVVEEGLGASGQPCLMNLEVSCEKQE